MSSSNCQCFTIDIDILKYVYIYVFHCNAVEMKYNALMVCCRMRYDFWKAGCLYPFGDSNCDHNNVRVIDQVEGSNTLRWPLSYPLYIATTYIASLAWLACTKFCGVNKTALFNSVVGEMQRRQGAWSARKCDMSLQWQADFDICRTVLCV